MELNKAPLLDDASIRDFQGGTAGYVADAVEQSLLLPKDMANLRFMRHYEVFLRLKRDLAMVSLLLLFIYLFLLLFFVFFNLCSLFFSGRPGHLQGRGDGDQLPPKNERGKREEDNSHGCLPRG